MVCGLWFVVYGLWFMFSGIWFMVYGLWFMVYGLWFMVYGLKFKILVQPYRQRHALVRILEKKRLRKSVWRDEEAVAGGGAAIDCANWPVTHE